MATSGIYTITNKINGKIYVGCSVDVFNRLDTHRRELKYKVHHNPELQKDYKLFGDHNFEFELLEEQPTYLLLAIETYWITLLDTTDKSRGYNYYSCWECGSFQKHHIGIPVAALTLDGSLIGFFPSCPDAERGLGTPKGGCNLCRKGYSTHSGGVVFMDKDNYINYGYNPSGKKYGKKKTKDEVKQSKEEREELKYELKFAKDIYDNNSSYKDEFYEFHELLSSKRYKTGNISI